MTDSREQTQGQQRAMALEYWLSVWGILSLALIFGPLTMLFPTVNERLETISAVWVSVPISLVCAFVIAFYMFTLRDALFRYTFTLSFSEDEKDKKKTKRSLPVWALTCFVISILLSFFLAFGAASSRQFVAQPGQSAVGKLNYGGFGHMIVKLFMTGSQVFMFVFLCLSAGIMAVYEYGKSIPVSGPNAPIYTDEDRLKDKVLEQASKELGFGHNSPTITDMKRSPSGGISLTLHHKGELIEQNDTQFREDKTWLVQADHRGQLIKVEEKAVRQSKVEAFQIEPVLAAVQEILGSDVRPTIASMRREDNGDVSLALQHEGKAWNAKADRWSRLIGLTERTRKSR
jgi:hypothetical protein